MEAVKHERKVNIITYDGYKIACFIDDKDVKLANEFIKKNNLDAAVLSTDIDKNNNLGYVLHFISNDNKCNVKRLCQLLIEEGKTNDLYWKHNSILSQTSAKVYSANLKLLK